MLVESRSPSGLVVMEQGSDYRSVLAALRDHDPDLRLVPQETDKGLMWRVFRYAGGDRPAEPVCGWYDENLEPLPLSHGLVERVKLLDRNTRARQDDPDYVNERRREAVERSEREAIEDISREFVRRSKTSPVFHRGMHLRRGDRLGRL